MTKAKKRVSRKPVYVSFCGRIQRESMNALIGTCTELANAGVDALYLMLSTPGGSVESAVAAYNLLRGMPFRVTTHNVGSVDSMGNVLFLAGDERYACPHSSFMFHGVGFNVSSRTRFEMKNLREKVDSVESDQRKIAAILADRTRIPAGKIDALFHEAVTREPDYALAHGIIDDVRELVIPAGAEVRQIRVGA